MQEVSQTCDDSILADGERRRGEEGM